MCGLLLFTELVPFLLLLGACAAGIVGHKIPHYSVFGENVKMADRLCHSSPGNEFTAAVALVTMISILYM